MPDAPHLRPATPEEIAQSLAFALQYNGRKRVHDAAEAMARITAERLVPRHSGFDGFAKYIAAYIRYSSGSDPTLMGYPPTTWEIPKAAI